MAKTNPFKNPKPFSIGDIIGTPDLQNISYTSFDYFAIKERTIEYLKKNFPDDFNDFTESDLGIMLIESWSFMADLISFKMDLNVNEMFIDTVSLRKNAHRLAKLVGYPARPPRASSARVSLTIPSALTFDINIPRGFSISVPSSDGTSLEFQLYAADSSWSPIFDEDILIPQGSITNLSVLALEGATINIKKVSDGTKFQQIISPDISILNDSVVLTVNNQKWTAVDFFNENDNGQYYMLDFDEDYRAVISFSDDIRGRIPPQGAQININYRKGGGPRGNIDIGFIDQVSNISTADVPSAIPIVINNYTKGEGGETPETIEEIKSKLPLWNKAQNRAVTGEDYTILAGCFSTSFNGRIGKAKAVLRNSGCSGNIIDIYVLQADSGETLKTANMTLKSQLLVDLENKKMLTDFICIKDAAQVFQDINVNIGVERFFSSFKKDILEKIIESIDDFFALSKWSIGQPLKKTDLIRHLNKISNISSINVTFINNTQNLITSNDEIIVDFWKIIRNGQINISIDIVD